MKMSGEEFFRNLKRGDIVRSALRGEWESYVVNATYGNRATAVRTIDITNPGEWRVVCRAGGEKKRASDTSVIETKGGGKSAASVKTGGQSQLWTLAEMADAQTLGHATIRAIAAEVDSELNNILVALAEVPVNETQIKYAVARAQAANNRLK